MTALMNWRLISQMDGPCGLGSPVGGGLGIRGADLVGGAPTPEAATFRKICMSKRKNWDP